VSEAAELNIVSIGKIDLNPGDRIIVRTTHHLSKSQEEAIRSAFAIWAEGVKVLVVPPDFQVSTVSMPPDPSGEIALETPSERKECKELLQEVFHMACGNRFLDAPEVTRARKQAVRDLAAKLIGPGADFWEYT
jgi:hypothetical protein